MATATRNKPAENGRQAPSHVIVDADADMARMRVRFVGTTPLIHHSSRGADLSPAASSSKLGKKQTKERTREEIAALGTYPVGDGTFYHPAEAFRSAAIDAVSGQKFGKDSAPNLLAASFFVVTEQAVLIDPDTDEPLSKYEIDERTARNPTTGGMVLAIRPLWRAWACDVEFEYDPLFIQPPHIMQALTIAGRKVGIGILRPLPSKKNPKRGKGGRYGKFKAILME